MNKITFVSYADSNFSARRDALCISAEKVGFDNVISLGPSDICHSEFWERNRAVIESKKRGAGYWLWKPYVIKTILDSLPDDSVLIYSDAGRTNYYEFKSIPHKLVEMVKKSEKGVLLGPVLHQHGALSKWTKRDCLILMNADSQELICKPTIQATWSLWKKNKYSMDFLNKWIRFCEDPRCLTDIDNTLGYPNYEDFVDHRHDQSILTILAYTEGVSYLDFCNTNIFNLLNIRPSSRLAHQFLKRIDDAEGVVLGENVLMVMLRSVFDIYFDKYVRVFARFLR